MGIPFPTLAEIYGRTIDNMYFLFHHQNIYIGPEHGKQFTVGIHSIWSGIYDEVYSKKFNEELNKKIMES